ncbi:MAG: peptidoglycan editing factor PgeF [Proteobacteria bacterium]|nr:peptidoglycan editing factor PgeF [Pseudomonadota bacterium]MDA1354773.1 peptidoglycan editing factor PgeF [Pseudomonadota bacterium]
MVSALEHDALAASGAVRHGFFTRAGGVSSGLYASLNCGYGSNDDPEAVRENRARAATAFGFSAGDLCTPYQIHSDQVVAVEKAWSHADAPRADALVSNRPGVVLGILTADCAPVLLADSDHRVIGALHAGWRGALGGILEAGVAAMCRLGAHAATIHAVIGPTIGPESYEVGPGFPAPFLAQHPGAHEFFRPAARDGHYLFDLPGYVARRLSALSLGEVAQLKRDTYAEDAQFFSYRRNSQHGESDYGRLLAAIALAD